MTLLYTNENDYVSEFYDTHIIIYSEKDICSSPNKYKLSSGIDIFMYQDIFCGIKLALNKLDSIILENVILLDNSYKITLADFISQFV